MTAGGEIGTIRDLIDRMARICPEAPFLLSPETGKLVTFRGLRERSIGLSNELALAGLEPGDKVAFLLDNGLFTAQLFLGVMYGNFVAVPLNVGAGVSQLSYTLDHCDARVVYVEGKYRSLAEELLANVGRAVRVTFADVDGLPVACEAPINSTGQRTSGPEDPALLMYTSGSTGQPKAAVHSHRTLLACAENVVRAHQLSDADRSLLVLPLYHMNGGAVTLVPTLIGGGSVVVPERFSVSQFWDLLDEHRCTWSALVPTIISQLLDWRDPRAHSRLAAFQRIRFLRSSSAPLSPSLHREFIEKFGLLLLQAMGSSEAGNVFSNPLPPGQNKIGSPGLPTGFEIKVVDREGVEVPPGEPGEVIIRGEGLAQGYYKDPEATAAVFDSDGWLHTGDLAYRDSDGYFFVVGRSKELIIKGGVNIAPRQIDEVLESHPAVLEAAAIGVPDRYLGEDLVAFVVLRTGAPGDERELLDFCEDRLGHFKTPTRVHFADDLPKGPSGKIQRLQLSEKAAQLASVNSAPFRVEFETANGKGRAPDQQLPLASPSIEQIIAESWAEVLAQPHVDSNSNFFALGGHSLLAVQCVSLLRDRVPVALSLSDFFEHTTVARQAALVTHRWHAVGRTDRHTVTDRRAETLEEALQNVSSSLTPPTIPPRDRTLPCPLSPGQRRLWFLDQLNPGSPAYNESDAYRLLGELNVDAMERALNVIVARHEVLRTTIKVVDTEPVAVVHESWPLQPKKIDLAALSASARQLEVERLLIEEPKFPYDLGAAPGIRITLVCLGPREHVLILMMHHIIADWSSEGIFWRELASLYRSFTRREPPALPPLTIQHGDYAAWQVNHVRETNFEEDLDFWEETLRGAPQLLELPADRTRPPILSYRGGRQRLFLNPSLTNDLRDLAKRTETTLFTVFAAALNTLLSRYTGKEDISLGVPIAERDRKELQSVIGFLLQTHILRTGLSPDMTFRKLLARVHKGVLGLYLHKAVPFDQVVSKLRPERNLSYSPLFQVMLIGRDPDQMLSFVGLEGLAVEPAFASSGPSKFDLTLFVTDCGDNIWLEMEYSTDLFEAARIIRMLGHYQTLLESVARDPDRRLAELPLLTQAERNQLLVEWNLTGIAYSKDRTLCELIEEQVKRTPDRVAAVFEDQQMTFRQLNDHANRLSSHLQNLGVGPNILVGICVERSLEMLVGLLGIMKAGGAYVPLDPAYPDDRLAFMVEDCQPRVLVTQKKLKPLLRSHQAQIVCLDALAEKTQYEDRQLQRGICHPGDLAYVLYTSGSTGKPKGVQISNRALVNFLSAMQREPGLCADDTLLAVTTLSFDIAGLELFLPLISGARVVIAGREAATDGVRLSSLLKRCGATVMQATPATWRLLLAAGWTGSAGLKILCGGDAWPIGLADELLPRCKSLWNMYGPTETTIWSSVARVEAGKPVVIGSPIANTTFYVLDERRELVPVGVPGELYIGGDGLADGYLNRPDMTAERFVSDPFGGKPGVKLYRTGDAVRRLSDGGIEFLHRTDQQVKIRGFRIELEEVEAVLKQHPGIAQCVAQAREDMPGDKRLVAYTVSYDPRVVLHSSQLREFLKQKLPDYMIPSAFVALEELPLTLNGKIDRKALPVPGLPSAESSRVRQIVPPRTPLEHELVRIWDQILGIKVASVSDNFFDLGGHSLLAVEMFARIEAVFKVRLPLATLYTAPAIKDIARILSSEVVSSRWSSLVPIQITGSRPPFFCFHGGGGNVLIYGNLARYLGPDQPFYGLQSQGLDGSSPLLRTIEEMAALYVKEIRNVQPHGPYLLGGYCLGGSIAYEAAQQLHTAGEQVALLALFDTMNWHKVLFTGWDKMFRRFERLVFHASVLLKFDAESKRKFLKGKFHELRNRIPVWRGMLLTKLRRRSVKGGSGSLVLAQVWQANHRASHNYIPKPYSGEIMDFRPARQYRVLNNQDLKWDRLAQGGQRVAIVPGYPGVMLLEPYVKDLAAMLKTCIDDAIRPIQSSEPDRLQPRLPLEYPAVARK